MRQCSAFFWHFLVDETGPTTVEYAMLILLIVLASLTGIVAVGQATAQPQNAS